MNKVRTFFQARQERGYITRYERAVPALIYFVLYMRWFTLLEKSNRSDYVVVHTALDDMIPFAEVFILPYLAWFVYVISTLAFLFFLRSSEDYYRSLIFMIIGMTFFLAFSTMMPTLQPLRPAVMPRDNLFTRMIANLYQSDTPTNVFPSMHVYNSIACMIALLRCKALDRHRVIRAGGSVLSILIILSTMFIKQHSVIDVAGAFALAFVTYRFVYQSDFIINALRIREREYSLPAGQSAF